MKSFQKKCRLQRTASLVCSLMYEAMHFFCKHPPHFSHSTFHKKIALLHWQKYLHSACSSELSIMQITTPLPSFRLVLKSYWAASDVPSSRRRLSISRTDFAINLLCLAFSQCRLPGSRGQDCSPTPIPYFPIQTKRYWTKWSFLGSK